MAEVREGKKVPTRRIRRSGRGGQVGIYLGKQLRFFINENDWKVLIMAAIIAGLVGMVIRQRLFITMEGSLMGGFALTCVAIWNGCFNSIQCVCRERPIIKREHRSGLHISSYVAAHMIYQLLLCILQTGITMYVLQILEIKFPAKGFMTSWMILDVGISMLLISYAADMMSLFISSISHTTTGAMTVMPFVLIFQLVFSGGVIPLPEWSQSLSAFTISSYGIQAITAQAGYNELPMVTAWNTLSGMRNREVGGTFTVEDVLKFLNSDGVAKYRDREVIPPLETKKTLQDLGVDGLTAEMVVRGYLGGVEKTPPVSLGELIDAANRSEIVKENLDHPFTVKATIGELLELAGEERVRDEIQKATAAASFKEDYVRSEENITGNWIMLILFALFFALMSVIALEMIDKDKR